MSKPLTVDPKVHELAEHLLCADESVDLQDRSIHEARVTSLAFDIQTAIAYWHDAEADYEAQEAERDAEMRALKGYTDAERERI